MKILLVEDHKAEVSQLCVLLREAAHDVVVVDSCTGAMHAIRGKDFDVLLCDLDLPDDRGCNLLPDLLNIRSLRAIAIMAYDFEEEAARAKAAGFDAVVTRAASDTLFQMLDDIAEKGEQFPFARKRHLAV